MSPRLVILGKHNNRTVFFSSLLFGEKKWSVIRISITAKDEWKRLPPDFATPDQTVDVGQESTRKSTRRHDDDGDQEVRRDDGSTSTRHVQEQLQDRRVLRKVNQEILALNRAPDFGLRGSRSCPQEVRVIAEDVDEGRQSLRSGQEVGVRVDEVVTL